MPSSAAWSSYGRAPKVDVHQFAMIPRAEIPRSKFRMQHQHKTTMSAGLLIPVYIQEVLPGDSFHCNMTAFCRLATPIFPIMDNMDIESFFFFVPNRLVWVHWKQFMGEQNSPTDSISYSIPQVVSASGGFPDESLYDYFGIPGTGQVTGTTSVSALPFRCYNLIFNEWFRDENLMVGQVFGSTAGTGFGGSAVMDDGPDPVSNYSILPTQKRHDYFTSCLPWTQKGGIAVTLPLGTSATVKTAAYASSQPSWVTGTTTGLQMLLNSGGTISQPGVGTGMTFGTPAGGGTPMIQDTTTGHGTTGFPAMIPTNLYADLSTATAATINSIRLAFQTQKLLERDARGGTRYAEIVRSHFGVVSPDMRLQRPEYLGGGKSPVQISAVPSTIPSTFSGTSNPPLGTLAAIGTGTAHHGFSQSFTEHGYILGLVTIRTDEIYQQGIRRLWNRKTRYDFYFPVFAMLGEQGVLQQEIYATGVPANDTAIFGYQEAWAEYRYHPSRTSAFFRSTNTTPLDAWHLATKFTTAPALNSSFIQSPLPTTLQRNLAAGALANNQQFLCDFMFDERVARPMPMYSVPGLIDHF